MLEPLPKPTPVAFNEGCDARLAGLPRGHNPYRGWSEGGLHLAWNNGWDDVEKYWGRWSGQRWLVSRLPTVGGGMAATTEGGRP